jgi:hypothetical protein
MLRKSALFYLAGLLLAGLLWARSQPGSAAAEPKPFLQADNSQVEPVMRNGKEAITVALERLRRTGCFNHPDSPWVVRARGVRGDTLFLVEFLLRRQDGKGFACVGKAVQVTLAFSDEVPFTLGESGAPVRRETLQVRARQLELETEGGTTLKSDERVFDLSLPSGLRESGFLPFAEAEDQLTKELRDALAQGFPLLPEQKMLISAFGEQCFELLGANIAKSDTGLTILAFETPLVPRAADQCKFPMLAVVRFDRKGQVLVRSCGKNITASANEVAALMVGDDSQSLTLNSPDGFKFILPGTKIVR